MFIRLHFFYAWQGHGNRIEIQRKLIKKLAVMPAEVSLLSGKSVQKAPSFGKGGMGRIYIKMLFYNKNNKQRSQYLRKNLTKAEMLLWSRLRRKQLCGIQFYRQKPIL